MKISETLAIVAMFIILAVFLFGGLGYMNYLLSKASCDQIGKRLGVVTIYEFPSGCYKLVKGKWALVQYQTVETSNEASDGR